LIIRQETLYKRVSFWKRRRIMNFDLYFAEQVLNGIKKVEIRDKPQEVNK
jgi:hypothetical protein